MRDAWTDLVLGGRCVGCARPGRSLCRACEARLPRAASEVRPTPCPDGLARCFAAGEYADPLRAMVLAHKEHHAWSLGRPLGALLAVSVQRALPPDAPAVLVPVPSRPAVVRQRGHDPLLRTVRAAARRLRGRGADVTVLRALCLRASVDDQAGLSATARAANLAGSMAVRPGVRDAFARRAGPFAVVVCDDVLTTGATAREAQRALEESGVRVRAVATVAATRRRMPPGASPGRRALPLSGSAD